MCQKYYDFNKSKNLELSAGNSQQPTTQARAHSKSDPRGPLLYAQGRTVRARSYSAQLLEQDDDDAFEDVDAVPCPGKTNETRRCTSAPGCQWRYDDDDA